MHVSKIDLNEKRSTAFTYFTISVQKLTVFFKKVVKRKLLHYVTEMKTLVK